MSEASRHGAGIEWGGLEGLEPELRRYLRRRCRDHSEVDDVVQETLLRAARYRPGLSEPERIGGWAQRIAGNLLRDRRRKEGRMRRVDSEVFALEQVSTGPEREEDVRGGTVRVDERDLDRDLVLDHLESSLQRLPENDREALRSYYSGSCPGEGTDRAARQLGVDRRLVKVRLYRARQRLARLLRGSLALAAVGELPAGLEAELGIDGRGVVL